MLSQTRISVAKLSRLIGTPGAPAIVDVCLDEDFGAYPRLLPRARRHRFDAVDDLIPDLRGRDAMIACQKGLKPSQGAGNAARSLEGGNFAWRDAGEMPIPAAKIPAATNGATLRVTRERPKADRIACPWLIRRFDDRKVRFMFVEASAVAMVAKKFDATSFDIDSVFWSHRGGRCTFDVMIEEFGLTSKPLARLAEIVRGADTNAHHLAPQSAGLLAASLGFSALYADDLRQLDAGISLYDAFYHWARDAFGEGHDWRPESMREERP